MTDRDEIRRACPAGAMAVQCAKDPTVLRILDTYGTIYTVQFSTDRPDKFLAMLVDPYGCERATILRKQQALSTLRTQPLRGRIRK